MPTVTLRSAVRFTLRRVKSRYADVDIAQRVRRSRFSAQLRVPVGTNKRFSCWLTSPAEAMPVGVGG